MEPPMTTDSTPPTARVLPSMNMPGEGAHETTRAEILVLATGLLFLAGQVCVLLWMMYRRAGSAAATAAPQEQEGHHRKVAIVLPTESGPASSRATGTNDDLDNVAVLTTNGEGEPVLRFRLRRRSSWGGHPPPAQQLGDALDPRGGRRGKSAGPPLSIVQDVDDDDGEELEEEKVIHAQTSRSSPVPDPEPETGHGAALTALASVGSMAAQLVTPAPLPMPSTDGDEGNGVGGRGVEDLDLDAPRAWGEDPGLLAASESEKPRSPRSPRVLAADQAAMMDALCMEKTSRREGDWKPDEPSPVVGAEVDMPALAFGFEDPLGVNRLVGLQGVDEEGHEAVELEARDGKRRDT